MDYSLTWSKVSKSISGATTAEEVIEAADLNWKVELQPLYLEGLNSVDGIKVIGKQVPNKMGVMRDIDRRVLGVVGNKYTPIQNRECFGFFDHLVDAGKARYTNAGQLDGGSRIFLIAEMLDDIVLNDADRIRKFYFLSSSHDGGSSVKVKMSSYRLVCSNGLTAEIPGTCTNISIQHSQLYKDKFRQAKNILGLSEIYYKALEDKLNILVNTPFNDEKMEEFVEKVFPATTNEKGITKVTTRTKKIRAEVAELFHTGVGVSGETSWDAYNAVTEYVDHHRKTNVFKGKNPDETKFDTTFLGTGSAIKQTAFQLLTV